MEEVPENRLEIEPFGLADLGVLGRHETGEVHRERGLERRVLAQVRHHHLLVGVLLQLQLDPHIVGRHVLDVEERRQLAADHDLGDALDKLGLVHHVGDARDEHGPAPSRRGTRFPRASNANRTGAGLVDLLQFVGRVEDVAARREIRPLHVAAELDAREVSVVEQLEQRRAHLAEVMRRDAGGHADGDAGGAVDEQVRQARGQHDGLGLRPVVARPERDGIPVDLLEHLVGDARQTALGVAHGRGRVAVERPEVARAVDERIAQREWLRHADEGVVNRGVAVRMIAPHHVADDLGALAALLVGREVLLPHREEDAALHGLEAVAHVGQRPRGDDRERVVEVLLLGRLMERDDLLAAAPAARTIAAPAGWRRPVARRRPDTDGRPRGALGGGRVLDDVEERLLRTLATR